MAAGEQNSEPFVVFLVGAEGSGKSTLFAQISRVVLASADRGCSDEDDATVVLLDAASIPAVPTAGQEFHTLSIDTSLWSRPLLLTSHSAAAAAVGEHTSDRDDVVIASNSGETAGNYRGIVPKASSDHQSPAPNERTRLVLDRQAVTRDDFFSELPRRVVAVNVRELGGGVAPSWGKFIGSRMQQFRQRAGDPTGRDVVPSAMHALVFTVDMTNLSQLPLASMEFLQLVLANDDVAGWPTRVLLLLTKCASPFARVTRRDVDALFLAPLQGARGRVVPGAGVGGSDCDSLLHRVDVLAVDAWVGLGVKDVVEWLLAQAVQIDR